jgi:hypothetical protein
VLAEAAAVAAALLFLCTLNGRWMSMKRVAHVRMAAGMKKAAKTAVCPPLVRLLKMSDAANCSDATYHPIQRMRATKAVASIRILSYLVLSEGKSRAVFSM